MTNNLIDIREKIATHKQEFEIRKRAEYAQESEEFHRELRTAIRDMYLAGISISNICEDYGTKDRNTVISVLKSFPGVYRPGMPGRPRKQTPTTAVNNSPAEPDNPDSAVAQWDTDRTTATFTYPGGEETVVVEGVDIPGRKFRFTDDTTATPEQRQDMNKARRDPEHWMWATLGGAA